MPLHAGGALAGGDCDLMPFSSEVQESGTCTGKWPLFLQFSLESVSQLLAPLEKGHRICGGWSTPPGKLPLSPKELLLFEHEVQFPVSNRENVHDVAFTPGKRNNAHANFAHLKIWDNFCCGKNHTFGEWSTVSMKYGIHLIAGRWWRMVLLSAISSSSGEVQPQAAWACAARGCTSTHLCSHMWRERATLINTDSQSTYMNTENTSSFAE